MISPLPSNSTQSEPPSVPASIEIPTASCDDNPFLNQFMVVPTLEEGHVPESSRKREKLPATIGTKVLPTKGATSHFTLKMPGK